MRPSRPEQNRGEELDASKEQARPAAGPCALLPALAAVIVGLILGLFADHVLAVRAYSQKLTEAVDDRPELPRPLTEQVLGLVENGPLYRLDPENCSTAGVGNMPWTVWALESRCEAVAVSEAPFTVALLHGAEQSLHDQCQVADGAEPTPERDPFVALRSLGSKYVPAISVKTGSPAMSDIQVAHLRDAPAKIAQLVADTISDDAAVCEQVAKEGS